MVSGKKSAMSTNHCARTAFWWVRACAPHLWFVHLPIRHFSLHLPPLQRPGMCVVDNVQRLRFASLLTSSQERVKQESLFTFTFTLRMIYEVNVTIVFTLYPIHTISLNLSAFYRASNQLFQQTNQSIDPSINPWIDQSIHRSIHRLINPSIHQSINP